MLEILEQIERYAPLFLVGLLLCVSVVSVALHLRKGLWARLILWFGVVVLAVYLTTRELSALGLLTGIGDVVFWTATVAIGLLLVLVGFVVYKIQQARYRRRTGFGRRRTYHPMKQRHRLNETGGQPVRYTDRLQHSGDENGY